MAEEPKETAAIRDGETASEPAERGTPDVRPDDAEEAVAATSDDARPASAAGSAADVDGSADASGKDDRKSDAEDEDEESDELSSDAAIPDVPPPGAIPGASQLPPAPIEAIEAIAAAVARLRSEVDATTDKSRKARLLNEAG